MSIIEEIGIRLHRKDILEMLQGSDIRVEDDTVFFTRKQIMDLVAMAPEKFTVFGRNSDCNLVVGGDNIEYAGGYGCTSIVELDGSRRKAEIRDYIKFIKLVHQSSGFHLNGGLLVQPSDIPVDQIHILMTYMTMIHSDKCIMGQPGNAKDVQKIMDMAGLLFDGKTDLLKKPRVMTLINTLSPLQFDGIALDTLRVCAENRQPVIICSEPMCGTTAPVTIAGAIAQGNAETLVGIAIAQIIHPGVPVIMAINLTPVDMTTGGVNIGAPAHALGVKYCAGLARIYGVPCRCGGNNTSASGCTSQSGFESMMSMFVSIQEKVNLILHSAGILDGWAAMSYEKYIMDIEIIRMLEYYFNDIFIEKNDLALEAIREVGPGGQFLKHLHTMKNCREEAWISDIAVTGPTDNATTPNQALADNATLKINAMLSAYNRPPIKKEKQDALGNYLIKNGVKPEMISLCREE